MAIVCAVACLLVLAFIGAPAAGAGASVFHTESVGLAFNQCSGELMNVTTAVTGVTRQAMNQTGQLHVVVHFVSTGEAVGLVSRDRYRLVSTQTKAEVDFPPFLPNGDFTVTGTSTLMVIGPGSVGDLRLHTMYHFTYRDGEIIVVNDNNSLSCT